MYKQLYEYIETKLKKLNYDVFNYYNESVKRNSAFVNISQVELVNDNDESYNRITDKKIEVELIIKLFNDNYSAKKFREYIYSQVERFEEVFKYNDIYVTDELVINDVLIQAIYMPALIETSETQIFIIINFIIGG